MKKIALKAISTQKDEDANMTYKNYEIYADETLIGSASVETDYEEENTEYSYIERIDIDEEFRNQGYGTAAIREISSMYYGAVLAPDNEDAKRLYERIGEEFSEDPYVYCDQGYGVYLV